jgi:transposase
LAKSIWWSAVRPNKVPLTHIARGPRQPPARKPLPDHLPREIVVLEPKFTCRCNDPSCRTKIREEVTKVLEKFPSQTRAL